MTGTAAILRYVVQRFVVLCILVVLTGGYSGGAHSQTIDPHELYEQQCGRCHTPHAGAFVHESLIRSEGRIVGRQSGEELRAFLEAGHGKLSDDEIDVMVAHLSAIQQSGRLFHRKCRVCHERAVVLARRELILRDGELFGRYSDRKMETFLSNHGRLTSDEVPKMLEVLKRQLETPGN